MSFLRRAFCDQCAPVQLLVRGPVDVDFGLLLSYFCPALTCMLHLLVCCTYFVRKNWALVSRTVEIRLEIKSRTRGPACRAAFLRKKRKTVDAGACLHKKVEHLAGPVVGFPLFFLLFLGGRGERDGHALFSGPGTGFRTPCPRKRNKRME